MVNKLSNYLTNSMPMLSQVAINQPKIDSKHNNYKQGINIMLILDLSQSMLEQDLQPNRLEAAKKPCVNLLKNEPTIN